MELQCLWSWTYIIDNKRNGLHINTSSEDISSYQDLCFSVTESVDDHVTSLALKFTGQGSDLVTLCRKAVGDLSSTGAGLHSHQFCLDEYDLYLN